FKFSVASYNVLSQNLLETNKYLYKKCHPKHLSWQFRKNLLKEELSYYQPDIICMQEVHKNEFSRFFLPELQKLGYFGLYKKRTSDKEDGCATFFKHDKFLCMSSKPMEFHCKGVEVLNRDNVGLLMLLKPVEKLKDFRLCVANTHLLFNPKRGDVKLAQLMTLMAGIDDLTDGEEQAVVLCGDFNSQPRSGLYDFLLSGRLDCKDVAI
ncbi:hypothetical protein HELRODRAFT_124292, partial [Helobdella robusta]|uniref:Endonuclease/exonuclease/phosphatase domain-containing protein n=1 Tax=Helobdella robusta TaxID=6412 RepID=T1EH08_HELRO